MKKIAILMLVLIMSISLPIIATAAGLPVPAVSAVQSGEAANSVPDEVLPDENDVETDSSVEPTEPDSFEMGSGTLEDQQVLEEAPPVKEKFTLFGFTVSNIVTTLLVLGVAITGLVTQKMEKW